MIYKLAKDAKLENKDNIYTIYSWERIVIPPLTKKVIKLPYKIENQDRYINFELNKILSLEGLQVLWHNLNIKDSPQLEILVYNYNFDFNILNGYQNAQLQTIIGSNLRLDIKPNIEFGKIYI